ncbi:MAG: prolipoprotein diacylglyceryl transferase [Vicinamibacterales bacterium]
MFRFGQFEITSFGVLVATGALVGLWILRRELRRSGLPQSAMDAAAIGIFGGLLGAKILWSIEHVGDAPFSALLFSRGGLSWFGGFAGGTFAGLAALRRWHVPVLGVLAAATPALAVGHAIGRIGCFLVGDDYGWPTNLPWGVAFPNGLPPTTVPVHPTQLYEALALSGLAMLLFHWRRSGRPDSFVFGAYLVLAGSIRFAIEFLRVHEPFLGVLAVAHVASLIAIAAGVVLLSVPHDR